MGASLSDIHSTGLTSLCRTHTQAPQESHAIDFVLKYAAVLRLKTFEMEISMDN